MSSKGIVALGLAMFIGLAGEGHAATIKVGSKNFTEQFIVAEIYAQALKKRVSPLSATSTSVRRPLRKPRLNMEISTFTPNTPGRRWPRW